VDAVITALGQEADWCCLTPECACTLTEWGTMNVDPLMLQSDDPDIFAGGDAVRGLGTVIEAIADGRQAAISIDRYIRGLDLQEGRDKEWIAVTEPQKEKYDPAGRAQMPRLEPEERLKSFDQVQQGFTEEIAVQEAQRCLSCGCACIQACPYDVIQFDAKEGKAHRCDLCFDRIHIGELPVCTELCLTDAIAFGEVKLLRQSAADQGYSVVGDLSKESVLYVK
jgi:ferredoxin